VPTDSGIPFECFSTRRPASSPALGGLTHKIICVEPADIPLHVRAQQSFREQGGASGGDFRIRRAQPRHVHRPNVGIRTSLIARVLDGETAPHGSRPPDPSGGSARVA